jgi:hypothetical protein
MQKKRPWSKLQREVYMLMSKKLDIQIHCIVYRISSQRGSTDLPRYWISHNKQIIWDYPKDFKEACTQEVYPYLTDVSEISKVIRDYIDTSPQVLFDKSFENDKWGITEILKVADRRIGKRRLNELKGKLNSAPACAIAEERLRKAQPSTYG